MNERPKLTLDNNCIINLLDAKSTSATSVHELSEIMRLALSGVADIAITTRVEADLENDKDAARKATLLKQIQMFPVIGTVGRWDVSKWDSGDVWGDDKTTRLADDLQKLIFPGGLNKESSSYGNKVNDIDHLIGHKINGRDIFVTDDGTMLRKSEELQRSPGIVVIAPTACLQFLQKLVERTEKVPLHSVRAVTGYVSKDLHGQVSFNFTNNNGRYVIGDGLFLFETAWTTAGADSIHVYNDPESIDSLAIAKGIAAISQIRNVSQYDFTSRTRTPKEGEVLVLQNTNGFYAAVKVLDVMVTDRGDERDELTIEYVIQVDGTPDFSN